MARFQLTIFSCVLFLNYQIKSQIIRPLNMLNRPYTETIIESPRNYIEAPCAYADAHRNYIESPRAYIDAPRNYIDVPIDAINYMNGPRIAEIPRNYMQTQPNIFAEPPCTTNVPGYPNMVPSTTLVTDCTPSVCKNLADTINLMVVSHLLQNTKGGDHVALQFAGPLLKDLLSNNGFADEFPNTFSNLGNPNLMTLNGYAPNGYASNGYALNGYAPNLVAPNGIAPNFLPQNVIAPNLVASNVYGPTPVTSRAASPISSVNGVVSPNAPINNGALLSSLLQLLGGSM